LTKISAPDDQMWGFPAMVLLEAMLSLRFGWIEIVSLGERLSLGG